MTVGSVLERDEQNDVMVRVMSTVICFLFYFIILSHLSLTFRSLPYCTTELYCANANNNTIKAQQSTVLTELKRTRICLIETPEAFVQEALYLFQK